MNSKDLMLSMCAAGFALSAGSLAHASPSLEDPSKHESPAGLAVECPEGEMREAPKPPSELPVTRVAEVQLGFRTQFVTDKGYDPFSSNNTFTAATLGVSRPVWQVGSFTLASGLFWDYGGRSGTAREVQAELRVHRVSIGIEGRYRLLPWVYGFARLAPGAMAESLTLGSALGTDFRKALWTWSGDLSAGAVVLLTRRSPNSRRPRFFAVGEGGYGFAGNTSMTLSRDADSGGPREESLNLGHLGFSGGFFRLAVAMAY